MTRAEVRRLVHKEVEKLMISFVKSSEENKKERLEPAIGFRWTPPEPQIGDIEPYDSNRKS